MIMVFSTNSENVKKYYIAYHFQIKNNLGFGSVIVQVDFNPFTVDGMEKVRQLVSKNFPPNNLIDFIFENNVNIVIINIIPLEN